ncbi:YopX family protein [Staphylococcus epidermidis]|nr:YopX family protein [Staphylococcus epidermidis]MCG1761366.1 YopX family protein [Staphylococcus epidermidis]MCG1777470.1 YopX family protein [Staphylococcus epidermidis]
MIPKFRVWDKDEKIMIDWIDLDMSKDGGEDDFIVFEPTGPVKSAITKPILMQSTGLKDKNGIEIYEGDIVQHSEKPNPCFSYPFKVIQARTGEWRLDNFRCGTVLAFSNQDELEVLGNIYENPELLEGD